MTKDVADPANKGPDAFRTISEVAEELGLPQHVLRFWETRFPQIKPIKRGGGRRYYRPGDVELLRGVKQLLYGEGYTIRGVQRILRGQGGRKLASAAAGTAEPEIPSLPLGEPETPGPEIWAPRRPSAASQESIDPVVPSASYTDDREDGPQLAPVDSAPEPRDEPPLGGLTDDQTARLAAALDELLACRRLLDRQG